MPRFALFSFARRHAFLLAIAGAIGLAFWMPTLGARDGPLHAALLAHLGVMLIFFLQGLNLRTRAMLDGLRKGRLHLFTQGWIFGFSALVILSTALGLRALGFANIAQGFFYLALLPTTIASAIAFTATANGNVTGAIFNCTFSNLLGVFWVPLGCMLLFTANADFQLASLLDKFAQLAQLILLPMLCGQLLRPFVKSTRAFAVVSPFFKPINHSVIVFIIYNSFCNSVLNATWTQFGGMDLLALLIAVPFALIAVHGLLWLSAKAWLSDPADRITALFCGAQKTLAAGAPMAAAIFSTEASQLTADLSLILLPLLCYHTLQLILAAAILPALQRK